VWRGQRRQPEIQLPRSERRAIQSIKSHAPHHPDLTETSSERRNRQERKATDSGLPEARLIRRIYRSWIASRMPRPAAIAATSPKALRAAMIPVLAAQVARKEAG
jgi:hypothetical protein